MLFIRILWIPVHLKLLLCPLFYYFKKYQLLKKRTIQDIFKHTLKIPSLYQFLKIDILNINLIKNIHHNAYTNRVIWFK